MRLYTVCWREPGFGIDIWTLERRLLQDEQQAWNWAYDIAQNHWHLPSFPADCIQETSGGIRLYEKNKRGQYKTVGEYLVIEFEY